MKTAIQQTEVEDPKAKKAPPKGKNQAIEESRPIFGKAWISLAELNQLGATKTKQRVYLQTCPPMVKKTNEDGTEEEVEE
jgi:predicted Zn-dependent protease